MKTILMGENNIITDNGKVIANHYMDYKSGWLIVFNKDIDEEKIEIYKEEIQKMADRNKIQVRFIERKGEE